MNLKLKNLSKTFESNHVTAVNNVNLEIREEEFLAIIGDSGSGKSTLLRLIGGLEHPSYGEIWLGKINISKLIGDKLIHFRRENIGFVFQDFNLVDFLTVRENIMLPLEINQRKVNAASELLNSIVDQLQINSIMGHYPQTLSGGEKQRVAIARALLLQPRLILADEPTGSLDSKNTEEVFKLLHTLSKQFSQTVIMVTHNISLAKRCDRFIEMKDGEIYAK